MLKNKSMLVKKDTVWNSVEYIEFVVIDVKEIDGNSWVFYRNIRTNQEYSCYVDAFASRFFINTNHRYEVKDKVLSWHIQQK